MHTIVLGLLSACVAVLLTSSPSTQSPFAELRKETFDPSAPGARATAVGDVDGDGIPDVVAGSPQPVLYRGIGRGRYSLDASSIPADQFAPTEVVLVDVDADRDLDCVIANEFFTDRLLVNDGTGRFAFASFPVDGQRTRGVTAFDVDGDGDQDLGFAVATEVLGGESSCTVRGSPMRD